ncbi:hypothetical protein M513_14068 [Trichuris suis]|uniref:Peptidase A2 domain-containing protein n=1 Tax=Trichuris suis TaxID=68888 RepID=A0A085LJA9_9BILA|nr:hypothetical protein M513_14068 [Trichuris suis]
MLEVSGIWAHCSPVPKRIGKWRRVIRTDWADDPQPMKTAGDVPQPAKMAEHSEVANATVTPRVLVEVSVNWVKFSVLVDTGAGRTLISDTLPEASWSLEVAGKPCSVGLSRWVTLACSG